MIRIEFFVDADPQPNPKFQLSGARVFPRDKGGRKRAWKELVALMARRALVGAHPMPALGPQVPCSVDVEIYVERPKSAKDRRFPSVRPDASNFYYFLENILEGIIYTDDAQVCDFSCRKRYADIEGGCPPGAHITIKEL